MTLTDLDLQPVDHARGKRLAVTCALKCGNACLGPECNTSGNPEFRSIASAAISRRAILGAGAAGAVVIALDPFFAGSASAAPVSPQTTWWRPRGGLPFDPIAPVDADIDEFTVPAGYQWQALIRWGDPVLAWAPRFDIDAQTPEAQAAQFGYNNDYLDILERGGGSFGVLVANHEYSNPNIMFPALTRPATADPASPEYTAYLAEVRRRGEIFKMAQGMTVIEVWRLWRGLPWRTFRWGRRNRRITVETPFRFSGPAAGSDLLKTTEDPAGLTVRGTLGNCAGGTTPWGTVLSGEENFNFYFSAAPNTPARARYGFAVPSTITETGWETFDPRFADAAGYENEPNRFGYIVEIDPEDPDATPVKHTAMGRFKHEGANVRVGEDGRVVAYMGDDERGDYLYKFVSKGKFDRGRGSRARRNNLALLSEGDLYVAKFSGDSPASEIDGSGALPSDGAFDGSGVWVPLTQNGQSAVPGFSIDEVLVYTRLAADAVGATKMDRPEDVEPHQTTGRVYLALTNNTQRGTRFPVDEPNPRTNNRDGHVVEITELAGQAGTTFGWSILLLCGNPSDPSTYFAGFPKEKVSPISCPDNVAFDAEGNLWISTDGQPSTIQKNDGLFKVPLEGPERGRVQQFLSVAKQAETCGPVIRDQENMVLVAVQHPGEGGTFEAPTSLFPDFGSTAPGAVPDAPRPSVVQVWRT